MKVGTIMPVCERCEHEAQCQRDAQHFCNRHAVEFLDEQIDRLLTEYLRKEATYVEKTHLWFNCLLPAARIREVIIKSQRDEALLAYEVKQKEKEQGKKIEEPLNSEVKKN